MTSALAASALAQGGTTWSTNYYAVTGDTLREIHESIDRARPWRAQHHHVAITDWSVRSRFAVAPFEGAFRCSGFTTLTTIRITMPRWVPPEGVSDEVRAEWERYEGALFEHEVGHGQFALAAAAEMHRRAKGLGTEREAEALKQRVEAMVVQVLEEFNQREKEYDRLTGHGAGQGAVFRHLRRRPTDLEEPAAAVHSDHRMKGHQSGSERAGSR
jgi:predicted secreted Zn-dependent protease